MAKKLVLFVGVHKVIDYATLEMAKGFRENGYECMIFDVRNIAEGFGRLSEFASDGLTAGFGFNNIGLTLTIDGKNIWELLNVPFIDMLMDNPVYYTETLQKAPKGTIVICIDKNHMNFVTRFFGNIETVGFLPLGGTKRENPQRDFSERSIDVLYAGTLGKKNLDKYAFAPNVFPDIDDEDIVKKCLDSLIENPNQLFHEVIEQYLEKNDIMYDDGRLLSIVYNYKIIEQYAIAYFREKIIGILVDNQIRVTVYGNGWEAAEYADNPNLIIKGFVDADEIPGIMDDTKVVLSTMTWFKDGTHDRIFNGMLSGAAVVSDTSVYMEENFTDEEVRLFRLSELEKLPDIVRELLGSRDKWCALSKKGSECAYKHTWHERAAELVRDVLDFL